MQSKLRTWVDASGGVPAVAKTLNVTEHSVRNWLRGESTPRSKTIKTIISLSKGTLTFDVIYKETNRSKK